MIEEIERDLAKYELQHALLDGVFEPARKKKNGHLQAREITTYYDYIDKKDTRHKDALYLKLLIPYHLPPQAETILLALLKLAGSHHYLEIEPTQSALPRLFDNAEGKATEKPAMTAIISQYQLLKEAGMSDAKDSYRLLIQYLEHMSAMMLSYKNTITGWFGSDHFLSFHANKDGKLIIKLNWRLAGAILGEYLYAVIDLDERHSLKKDASKTLHRWLSAHLWAGKSEFIHYETLVSHIWTQEARSGTQRKRLHALKHEILPELAKLPHWKVEVGKDGAHITHCKEIRETTVESVTNYRRISNKLP